MLKNSLRTGSAAVALLISCLAASAQSGQGPAGDFRYYHGPGMMWGGGQWGGFGMVLGPIFMILILIGVIAGTIYLLRLFGLASVGPGEIRRDSGAISILKERLARGEIDAKEFEERKRLLVG